MPASIEYDGDLLYITGLECDCPCDHNEPTQDVYVGTDLIAQVPELIRSRELGEKCVLVADENTYAVAGRDVERALRNNGFIVTLCLLKREGELEPNEAAVGEVLLAMDMATEFLVSVGSGTITDTTRVVAAHTERPFVCVGTAPSMDGYTSIVAPLLLRGVKIHRAAICPEIIVCDLDVMRTAPLPMFISGVGDVLGKYIAKADWVIGNIVNGEHYCPMCGDIVIQAVDKLLDNIDEIKNRTREGTKVLIEALLLSGLTIMIVGHTRAVASIEHNIVHYWDMQKLQSGERQPPHGTAVGIATLLVWPYFERFAKLDLSKLDENDMLSRRMSREERTQFMIEQYGEEAALSIMEENDGDFLSDEEHLRRIRAARAGFSRIQAEIAKLPPYERIESAMTALGAPMAPADLGIDDELVNRSLRCAKDYRTRYSLFKTMDELGLDL